MHKTHFLPLVDSGFPMWWWRSGDGGAAAAAAAVPVEEREERIRVVEREVFLVQMKTNLVFPSRAHCHQLDLGAPGPVP